MLEGVLEESKIFEETFKVALTNASLAFETELVVFDWLLIVMSGMIM